MYVLLIYPSTAAFLACATASATVEAASAVSSDQFGIIPSVLKKPKAALTSAIIQDPSRTINAIHNTANARNASPAPITTIIVLIHLGTASNFLKNEAQRVVGTDGVVVDEGVISSATSARTPFSRSMVLLPLLSLSKLEEEEEKREMADEES